VSAPAAERTLVVTCAALVRELRSVLAQFGGAASFDVVALPAPLHNRPERIPDAVTDVLDERAGRYDHAVVVYGDCGTGGLLDARLAERGVARMPGPHCYSFFAGAEVFDALAEEEPGTFYLTDFLARHADALVFGGLGLDRHPELRDLYFGNYVRVVLLSQDDDPELAVAARRTADRLGLAFEHRHVGLAPFAASLGALLEPAMRR
jgi:hypothetical protein